jgi:ribosome biogenesis GTPase
VTSPQLEAYGWGERWAARYLEVASAQPDAQPGRIVRHDGSAVLAVPVDGTLEHLHVPPGVEPSPVVGDWVAVDQSAQVVAVVPRHSLLRRQDPGTGGEQPLVANVDVVFVVCGLDRPVKPGRIERSVTLAWDAGAVPVVVLTKADLVADPEQRAETVRRGGPGIDVVLTSATTGDGLDEVRRRCCDRTVVLLGESGAGKSTMTNALAGGDVAATGLVRGGDSKGRHTTTARHLYPLPSGGVLVDTPGLRAVGLSVDLDAVAATFADIEAAAASCRFNDCRHDREPGCAVIEAVATGELATERWENWTALLREAEAAERRADEHRRREHDRRSGQMARDAQRRKRPGR